MKANYGERFIMGIVCAIAVLSPRAAAAQSNPAPCSLLTQAPVGTAMGVSRVENAPDQMSMEKTLAGNVLAKL
jgi:hypothetical protein